MTLFAELVIDQLKGPWGRMRPDHPLWAACPYIDLDTVPVPRNVPSSPKVHVSQPSTDEDFPLLLTLYVDGTTYDLGRGRCLPIAKTGICSDLRDTQNAG